MEICSETHYGNYINVSVIQMNKTELQPGRKYLHRHKTIIGGTARTAERWMRCERITKTGAVFSRDVEAEIDLTDKQIKEELLEGWGK